MRFSLTPIWQMFTQGYIRQNAERFLFGNDWVDVPALRSYLQVHGGLPVIPSVKQESIDLGASIGSSCSHVLIFHAVIKTEAPTRGCSTPPFICFCIFRCVCPALIFSCEI